MSLRKHLLLAFSSLLVLPHAAPQTSVSSIAATAPTAVPPLIPYSATATSPDGKPLTGELSITFLLFKDEHGGEPLWVETQSVVVDALGHYKVQLGASSPSGMPSDVFASGEGRWLEVQIAGKNPEPRVLFMSVPYAMKAADAATLGGLPPSAFALASQGAAAPPTPAAPPGILMTPNTNIGGTGTQDFIPLWTTSSGNLGNSVLFQSGSGGAAKIGVNTTTPASTLDVAGGSTVRGVLSLPSTGTATATVGFNSQPLSFAASVFNGGTKTPVTQTFRWQAEPVNNDKGNAGASLNLLFGAGSSAPAETGLKIGSNGEITFAPGQQFSGIGTGNGTITGVTAGTALTGGGTSGNVRLNVDTTKVPLLAANNTFTGNQAITGNLSAAGTVTAAAVNAVYGFDLGGSLFAFGSRSSENVYLGFAGNSSTTGYGNTASGFFALNKNTTGFWNTANGQGALQNNSTGIANTASGVDALETNTRGSGNTANGVGALYSNTTGVENTASGVDALQSNTSGGGNTANGVGALQSNSTGNYNAASGLLALYKNTTGYWNTASGSNALQSNTNGSTNTASGYDALTNNTTGSGNTAIGGAALARVTTGNNNVAVGNTAGITLDGSNITGSNNILLGFSTSLGTGAIMNATAVGAFAEVVKSNTIVLGCVAGGPNCPASVSVGIGTTTPDNLLTVNGKADKPGGGSWGTYSDGRLKTMNGSFGSGLDQVLQLHPIRYRYKPDNALGIHDAEEHIGVVAQDVQRIIPEAVTKNGNGYLLVNNDPIIWSMVNALKEQQREIEQQQKLLRAQSVAMRNLEAEVREARRTLRTVKAEVATAQSAVAAARSTPGLTQSLTAKGR